MSDQPLVKPISEAQLAANRANAKKSTGPKTEAGKIRSRANALKHGLCSVVIEIPGEDPHLADARAEVWNAEMNPGGSNCVAYLLTLAARHSVQLDRCELVHRARIAKLARDGVVVRNREWAQQIEAASRLLATEPDIALRTLLETSAGCSFLLKEFDYLSQALDKPATWDLSDAAQLTHLLGDIRPMRREAMMALVRETTDIDAWREVDRKLFLNNEAGNPTWDVRYSYPEDKAYDERRVGPMKERADECLVRVEAFVKGKVAELRERKALLEKHEELDLQQVPWRARFDGSAEGTLMHRYATDHARSLHKDLAMAMTMAKAGIVAAEIASRIEVATEPSAKPTPVKLSKRARDRQRNEANRWGGPGPFAGRKEGEPFAPPAPGKPLRGGISPSFP